MKKQFIITYTSLSVGWLLLMIAIFSIILSGCSRDRISGSGHVVTDTRPAGIFTDVEISGPFEVHLLQENNPAVDIKAEDNIIGVIETGVSNNSLYVRIKNHVNLRRHLPIKVYVHNPAFRRVKFNGSGSLDNKDTLQIPSFSYELNGSANASLAIRTTDFSATVNGSGNIGLKGSAATLKSDINGSGNITAMDMEVQNAQIAIRGSGEHSILVRQNLDAKIFGSGNIIYTGDAKVVAEIKGSGRIIKQ